jgi:DNA-binding beta-propeller fold protein YncE
MGGTRKIFVVDATGNASVFVASTAGLASVLGLRVDDARGELWAVSNHLGNPVPGTQSGLFRFRISDGAPIGRYPLEDDGKHGLNDVVVAPDGDVYATATNGSTVVELDPSIGKFRDFLPEGAVPDANGITISPDGRFLFVAGWYSITRIEWRTRQVQVLKKPDNIADGCNDGLYYYGRRSLVGIQNCVHVTGRVMRYDLSPDLSTITKATVLESYNPVFDGITTGAIAGQEFFFIGNTQLRKLSATAQTHTSVDPFVMLRVQMGAR